MLDMNPVEEYAMLQIYIERLANVAPWIRCELEEFTFDNREETPYNVIVFCGKFSIGHFARAPSDIASAMFWFYPQQEWVDLIPIQTEEQFELFVEYLRKRANEIHQTMLFFYEALGAALKGKETVETVHNTLIQFSLAALNQLEQMIRDNIMYLEGEAYEGNLLDNAYRCNRQVQYVCEISQQIHSLNLELGRIYDKQTPQLVERLVDSYIGAQNLPPKPSRSKK